MAAFYLWLKAWLGRQDGQDLIEYALIIALMVVLAVLGLTTMGNQISNLWNHIGSWLSSVAGTAPL